MQVATRFLKYITRINLLGTPLPTGPIRYTQVISPQTIQLEQLEKLEYKLLDGQFFDTKVQMGDVEIKNIYINGLDEMKLKTEESSKNTVWFYIVPNGLTQEVLINYDINEAPRYLEIDPFTANFSGGYDYKTP